MPTPEDVAELAGRQVTPPMGRHRHMVQPPLSRGVLGRRAGCPRIGQGTGAGEPTRGDLRGIVVGPGVLHLLLRDQPDRPLAAGVLGGPRRRHRTPPPRRSGQVGWLDVAVQVRSDLGGRHGLVGGLLAGGTATSTVGTVRCEH